MCIVYIHIYIIKRYIKRTSNADSTSAWLVCLHWLQHTTNKLWARNVIQVFMPCVIARMKGKSPHWKKIRWYEPGR